jgi:hypothetical protein
MSSLLAATASVGELLEQLIYIKDARSHERQIQSYSQLCKKSNFVYWVTE